MLDTYGTPWRDRTTHRLHITILSDTKPRRFRAGDCRVTPLIWLIIFLLIGAVAGWFAELITEGGGFVLLGDIVVGIIGSLIGGWLFAMLGIAAVGRIGSIIAAVVGVIVIIAVVRAVNRA
jgi:uncharacterized membrane protein YeaQ/YmgE (transglycosylase-associated protein family)